MGSEAKDMTPAVMVTAIVSGVSETGVKSTTITTKVSNEDFVKLTSVINKASDECTRNNILHVIGEITLASVINTSQLIARSVCMLDIILGIESGNCQIKVDIQGNNYVKDGKH